ncbi:MAG: response regulator transcription factor [Syntrophales bacterium]
MLRPILVVEDDKKIARVVKVYLEGDGHRVIHAESGRAAIDAAQQEMPLLVILDLMLPDISGEEVLQELKSLGDFPIVMLTSKSSEEERVAGFALGADDYVVKPFSPRELVYRVKAVLKRANKQDLTSAASVGINNGALIIDGHRYEVKKNGVLLNLTPTEFKLLFVLASHPERVMTRDMLVNQALGYQFDGYERSVDAHIKNIRQKIEDDPRNPSFILTVYGVGYKFIGKRDD